MALQNTNPTATAAWKKLQNHFSKMKDNSIKEMFENDSQRAEKFHIQWNDFLVDYSKNNINEKTIDLLLKLTEEINLSEAVSKYFQGDVINKTENMPMMAIKAIDFKAGCPAKISTPMPKIVVATDSKIEVLYVGNSTFPKVCSFCRAIVIKIL